MNRAMRQAIQEAVALEIDRQVREQGLRPVRWAVVKSAVPFQVRFPGDTVNTPMVASRLYEAAGPTVGARALLVRFGTRWVAVDERV
jgi:hypothetical protein